MIRLYDNGRHVEKKKFRLRSSMNNKYMYPQAKETLHTEEGHDDVKTTISKKLISIARECSQSKINIEYSRSMYDILHNNRNGVSTNKVQSRKIERHFNLTHNNTSSSYTHINIMNRPSSNDKMGRGGSNIEYNISDREEKKKSVYNSIERCYRVNEKDKVNMGKYIKNMSMNILLSKKSIDNRYNIEDNINRVCMIDIHNSSNKRVRHKYNNNKYSRYSVCDREVNDILQMVSRYMLSIKYKRECIVHKIHEHDTQYDDISTYNTTHRVGVSDILRRRYNTYNISYENSGNSIHKSMREYDDRYRKICERYDRVYKYTLDCIDKNKDVIDNIDSDNRYICDDNKYKNMVYMRQKIVYTVKKMKRLGISLDDLLNNKPFPTRPFERQHADKFIKAVKKNDMKTIKQIITLSRYIVHSYDWNKFSCIHWAVKRGYIDIVVLLLNKGADIEEEDPLERTPLWYALHNNNTDIVLLLLLSYDASLPKHVSVSNLREIGCNTFILKIVELLISYRYVLYMLSSDNIIMKTIGITMKQKIKQIEITYRDYTRKNK